MKSSEKWHNALIGIYVGRSFDNCFSDKCQKHINIKCAKHQNHYWISGAVQFRAINSTASQYVNQMILLVKPVGSQWKWFYILPPMLTVGRRPVIPNKYSPIIPSKKWSIINHPLCWAGSFSLYSIFLYDFRDNITLI